MYIYIYILYVLGIYIWDIICFRDIYIYIYIYVYIYMHFCALTSTYIQFLQCTCICMYIDKITHINKLNE